MARITSEKATEMIGNKFEMILVAANRARELAKGSAAKVNVSNGHVVTALKEIEQGLYTKQDYLNSLRKGYK
jgi:DNA-directed RNA polymerase subunit omega